MMVRLLGLLLGLQFGKVIFVPLIRILSQQYDRNCQGLPIAEPVLDRLRYRIGDKVTIK